MSSAPFAQRRRYPRATLLALASLEADEGVRLGRVLELSIGGAFISGPRIAVGARVAVTLKLPRDPIPVEVDAEVRYQRPPTGDDPAGVGIAFEDPTEADRARIARTVEASDQLHLRILAAITEGRFDREAFRSTCVEAGLPPELPVDELRRRVEIAIERYRSCTVSAG